MQPRALTNHTSDGRKVHSFQTLLRDLAMIVKTKSNRQTIAAFDLLTRPTAIQQRSFDLVGVPPRLP